MNIKDMIAGSLTGKKGNRAERREAEKRGRRMDRDALKAERRDQKKRERARAKAKKRGIFSIHG